MFLPPLGSSGDGRLTKVTSSETVLLSPLENNSAEHFLALVAAGFAPPTIRGQPKGRLTHQSVKLIMCNEMGVCVFM